MIGKKKLILGIISIVAILGFAVSAYVWKQYQNLAHTILEPGKIQTVNVDGWKMMKVGLTKGEVIKLLGDSASKRQIDVNDDGFSSTQQFWEYNYKSGVFQGPDSRAYVVYFNSEGVVTSFREPQDTK